jgi:hypothetical protein
MYEGGMDRTMRQRLRGDGLWWAIVVGNAVAVVYLLLRAPRADAVVVFVGVVLIDAAAFVWQIVEAARAYRTRRLGRSPVGASNGDDSDGAVVQVRIED